MPVGLLLTTAGFAPAAVLPGLLGLLVAALAIGIGTGLVTPLAFAALAASTPPERLGQTMGNAEVGRELGDAGGPLLVGGIAVATTVSAGLLTLAAPLAATAAVVGRVHRAQPAGPPDTSS
jgi:DHA1 family tetracycline resistance protein-like MFS transporter